MSDPIDFGVKDHTVVAWHYTPDHQLALRFADTDRHGALVIGWQDGELQILLMDHEEAAALSVAPAEKERRSDHSEEGSS